MGRRIGERRTLLCQRWRCRGCGGRRSPPHPDQDFAVLVNGESLALNDFGLQILEVGVIQIELPFEGTVGHAAAALEHGNGLVQKLLKCHLPPSTQPWSAARSDGGPAKSRSLQMESSYACKFLPSSCAVSGPTRKVLGP